MASAEDRILMEYAYSILMGVFALALLLYAGLIALTKSTDLIARSVSADIRDKKAYAAKFARVLALCAAAPAASALVGLIPGAILVAVLVLIAGFGLAIWLGVKRMGDA